MRQGVDLAGKAVSGYVVPKIREAVPEARGEEAGGGVEGTDAGTGSDLCDLMEPFFWRRRSVWVWNVAASEGGESKLCERQPLSTGFA